MILNQKLNKNVYINRVLSSKTIYGNLSFLATVLTIIFFIFFLHIFKLFR